MKTMHRKDRGNLREAGAALVVTLIVCAVLAMVVVALMQNTGLDRASSRSISNQYRAKLAAESGLAEAMTLIQSNVIGFNYVSGSEPQGTFYRTYIRRRSVTGGSWTFAGSPVYLDSGVTGDVTNIVVAGSNAATGVVVRTAYKTNIVINSSTNRYAFWVDEAGAKQNISWWGGGGSRGAVTNVTNLSLVVPSWNGSSVQAVLASLTDRTYSSTNTSSLFGLGSVPTRSVSNSLLTAASLNLANPAALNGVASSYFFALSNPASAITPLGGMKLNLVRLTTYLNSGISSAQGAGSPKALLIDELLKPNSPQQASWGGGNLSWLATSGKYTAAEQKQIVANLIDYLDDDLIPTTDDTNAPTYFGVEMKADSSGRVIGHPSITFVCAGLVFNRNTGGEVNSSRVLCSLGLVYPWSSTGASAAAYTPEINIAVEGTVQNPVLGLGSQAGPYFQTNDLSEQLTTRPVATFTPQTGNNWPESVGLAGSASYATPFYGFSTGNWPARGPTNMTLQDCRYVIKKLRLRYVSPDGTSGYVQVLPANKAINILPASVLVGGASGSLLVKFSSGGPYANTANLYLNEDPRASFRSDAWTNLASVTTFGTGIPTPSAGNAAITLTNKVTSEWDQAQGLPMNFTWYTSPSVTNHFARATNSGGFQSIGELGYLWTGRSWQTLNMVRTNSPATADYNLLDYVAGGFTNGATNFTTMPIVNITNSGSGLNATNSLLQDGGFNVMTRKLATVAAFLTNAPGVNSSAANNFASAARPELASGGGALATMSNLSSSTSTKFAAEAFTRATANAAVTQSRAFTVYCRGEHITPNSRSTAVLEAELFVDVNPLTGSPVVRVISRKFL